MKGKLNLKYKITSVILAIVSVAACLLFTLNSKTNYVAHAAHSVFVANTSTGEKQFSAKFGGDVIFSVEKVLMNSSITNTVGDAVSYDLTGSTEFVRTFYERTEGQAGGEERLFYDYNYLHEGYSNGKYVVEDGAFVMLENKQQSNKFVTNEDANLTEAIVVSFGQYIYSTNNGYDVIDYPEVYDATNNTNPLNVGVTTLTVNGYHNSLKEKMSNLPGARNIVTNSGIYLDFMFIIPQVAGNDGYYKFDFDYLVNGVRYSESFEFYLLFETTYKSEVEFAANSYNIAPTLGWTENNSFELASETSGYARYYIGKSGLTSVTKNVMSYPTITYDYSKYTFGYTHVANGKSTKYDFAYNYTINSGNISGDITYTTSSGLSTVKPLQYIDETNKLISIILTEPGTYEFEFDFIYSGFNSSTKPDMNLDVEKLPKLYIHGSNLQYSKYNYLSAEMQYYSVSNNLNDKVDFIFPNAFDNISKANRADNIDGKDIADYKNGSIGFTYKVENNQNTRVGEINIDNSQTTLLNADLTNNKTITEATQDNDLEYLTTNVKEDTKSAEVNTIFETLKFEKTNQGSLWFTMNDTYKESFYYYSSNKDTLLDGG